MNQRKGPFGMPALSACILRPLQPEGLKLMLEAKASVCLGRNKVFYKKKKTGNSWCVLGVCCVRLTDRTHLKQADLLASKKMFVEMQPQELPLVFVRSDGKRFHVDLVTTLSFHVSARNLCYLVDHFQLDHSRGEKIPPA